MPPPPVTPGPDWPAASRSAPARPGYTLIELLTVVAVVAIVSAVALPRLSGSDDARLRGAARMLAADLAFAQARCLADGENPVVVVFDPANDAYRLAPAADPDHPVTDPIRQRPYVTAYGSGRASHLAGVDLVSADAGGDDTLAFSLYGNLDQGDPAVITLAIDGRTTTVTINPDTGEARVE